MKEVIWNDENGEYCSSLEEQIGRGAWSRVYRSIVEGPGFEGQTVATKVFDPTPIALQKAHKTGLSIEGVLKRELRRRVLDSEDVLPVLAAFNTPEYKGIVMPLADRDLGGLFDTSAYVNDTLVLYQAFSICRSVARALGDAHNQGLVHADVKPENILVTHSGSVSHLEHFVLTDFTGASFRDSSMPHSNRGHDAMRAPETFNGRTTARSDVWAVGALLYHLVKGHSPYQYRNESGELVDGINPRDLTDESFDAHLYHSLVFTKTPQVITDLIRVCCAYDSQRRPKDGNELHELLKAVHESNEIINQTNRDSDDRMRIYETNLFKTDFEPFQIFPKSYLQSLFKLEPTEIPTVDSLLESLNQQPIVPLRRKLESDWLQPEYTSKRPIKEYDLESSALRLAFQKYLSA